MMKGFSVTPDNGRAAGGSRQAASYVLVINLNKMSVVHSNQLVCTVQLASQCAHGNHNLKLLIEQVGQWEGSTRCIFEGSGIV